MQLPARPEWLVRVHALSLLALRLPRLDHLAHAAAASLTRHSSSLAGTTVQGLIRADGYKLLLGEVGQDIWQGPLYPNASTNWVDTPYKCGVPGGKLSPRCLFNVFTDPTEHNDVSASNPDIIASMYARILELQKSAFSPNRGTDDGVACDAATQKWGGFWGPFVA
jgi:arylsulfatase I/J